jgi:hypothetical protein
MANWSEKQLAGMLAEELRRAVDRIDKTIEELRKDREAVVDELRRRKAWQSLRSG